MLHRSGKKGCCCLVTSHVWLFFFFCNPMDCSPPRLLWPWDFPGKNTEVAISFSKGSTQPGDWTCVSCKTGGFFTLSYLGKYLSSFFFKHLFISLFLSIWFCWLLVVACGIFSCHMWDLVPWPGMEPRPPALNTQSLSHWITREVLEPKQSRNANTDCSQGWWRVLRGHSLANACLPWNLRPGAGFYWGYWWTFWRQICRDGQLGSTLAQVWSTE